QQYLGQVVLAPPYPGAKEHFLIAAELDDPERLHTALEITAEALPEPKPKGKARLQEKGNAKAKSRLKAKEVPKAKGRTKVKAKLKAKRRPSK
ncbi:MAG: hypothetical protein ACYC2K_10675, partial [Gemmatimonadales bacterium]